MKKKLISTLLIIAFVFCLVPVAFPTIAAYAHNPECTGCDDPSHYNTGGGGTGGAAGATGGSSDEINPASYHERLFVWVSRSRDKNGDKDDRVKMEFVPVKEEDQAEYLERYKDFTGWDEEPVFLYSPARNWLSVQAMGHLERFEGEHIYGGKSSLEMGFIDANYNVPEGPVYYEHEGFEDNGYEYGLMLRIGEFIVELPAEFSTKAFAFAAKPDGSDSWEIILKDADGNDVDYSIVE